MIAFPNCKINIGLRIIAKRQDGFHDLETIFIPLQIRDALEIIEDDAESGIAFSSSGLTIDGPVEQNLCVKAYNMLKQDYPHLPSIKMHLHKSIPIGAGAGGGSADAAFALRLLNDKFELGISENQLHNYALQLGSDCPFFLINSPSVATGRGDILKEVALDLSAYTIIFVNPGIHINTGWAFSQLTLKSYDVGLADAIKLPMEQWPSHIFNDFEEPVFLLHPEIAEIKRTLYDSGALYASMTGSGSSVYGIFQKHYTPNFHFPDHYFCKSV